MIAQFDTVLLAIIILKLKITYMRSKVEIKGICIFLFLMHYLIKEY